MAITHKYEQRLEGFRTGMKDRKVDAALITGRENSRYLSGFSGTTAWLLVTSERSIIITDSRYREQATAQSPGWEVMEYKGSLEVFVNSLLREMDIASLGFEDRNTVYARYVELDKKLNAGLKPLGTLTEDMRIIKDEAEVSIIKKAVEIADEAFTHIVNVIRPGMTELETAAEIEYFMKKRGAEKPSFETIIASGERSSMVHGVASERVLERGDAVVMDFGAVYQGYCSDMTRTIYLGEPDEETRHIYQTVLDAQKKAVESVCEGLKGKDIDGLARNYIKEAGYAEYFGHGLGHGVGLEVHEEPKLSVGSDTVMKEGMAVTVEPGIYIPGRTGVRIEDIVIVDGDEAMVLTSSPKELTVI